MKKVLILGAGYTGMSAAKKLLENGFKDITIYEKEDYVGGMAKCIEFENTYIEKHYRHIFKSDKYVIDLINQMNLSEKLIWPKTKMGYYTQNNIYAFGQPLTLLTFKPFNLFQKIRFGISYIKIKMTNNVEKLEEITAKDWLIKNCGNYIYETIWEPLLDQKFGNKKEEISMAWLWGKICLRSSSLSLNREELGYLKGSFELLTNKLKEYLISNGVKICLNSEVNEIKYDNNKWNVLENRFDIIITTLPYHINIKLFKYFLTESEKKKMELVKYTSARTMILYLKNSLSDYYWLNIGDKSVPFGGVIEHTNLINSQNYNGKNIVYISNYMYKDNELYSLNKEELLERYMVALNKIYKNFSKDDIIDYKVFSEEYAQPIIEKNYSNIKMPYNLSKKGLYMATMPQIYPEDRGMNYAIKSGYEIADIIGGDFL